MLCFGAKVVKNSDTGKLLWRIEGNYAILDIRLTSVRRKTRKGELEKITENPERVI